MSECISERGIFGSRFSTTMGPHFSILHIHSRTIYLAVLPPSMSGVNFINVFMQSFYLHISQKCKKLLNLTVFFALWESSHILAVCKMLMKLTPAVVVSEESLHMSGTSEIVSSLSTTFFNNILIIN